MGMSLLHLLTVSKTTAANTEMRTLILLDITIHLF
jgi:hypothetical protein